MTPGQVEQSLQAYATASSQTPCQAINRRRSHGPRRRFSSTRFYTRGMICSDISVLQNRCCPAALWLFDPRVMKKRSKSRFDDPSAIPAEIDSVLAGDVRRQKEAYCNHIGMDGSMDRMIWRDEFIIPVRPSVGTTVLRLLPSLQFGNTSCLVVR